MEHTNTYERLFGNSFHLIHTVASDDIVFIVVCQTFGPVWYIT